MSFSRSHQVAAGHALHAVVRAARACRPASVDDVRRVGRVGRVGPVLATIGIAGLLHGAAPRHLGGQSAAPPASDARERVDRGAPGRVVRGVVRDAAGVAIAGARVRLVDGEGRQAAVTSDADGRFALQAPGGGRHALDVRALGYRPLARALVVRGDAGDAVPEALDLRLERSRSLTPVTVIGATASTGRALPSAADVLTSVSVLGAEQVARENVQFAQEILRKVPGVYHANFNQGIISGDFGIRGFNAESDVASTKLVVDGIPTNLNSGLGEFNALFPLEIERVEIVRGTNDPRYGLFNLAGNVGVTTRGTQPAAAAGGSYVAARALTGSFGTREAQGVATRTHALGREGRGGSLAHTWFGGWRDATGFRANSALDKRAGSGKVFWTSPGGRVRVGAIARVQALDTDAPGYLTAAEARATPRYSPAFADADGGSVDTRQASVHLEARPTETVAASARLYDQRFERVRYVRFSAAGAQQERVEDERQRGAILEATWRPAALARVAGSVAVGADWQHQDNVQQRYRTVARVREATLRDYAFTFANGGGFARVDAKLGPLTVDAGLRLDRVDGDFRDVPTGATRPMIAYGWIPQPKASATLALVSQLSVYGNYGRGFQTGTGLAAYAPQPASGPPLTWSKNDGYEAGLVLQPLSAWSVRAGAWRQDATDEVRLRFDNSGDSENVGRTRRTGVDVESTLQLGRGLSVWGALTTQRAVLVEPGASAPELRGNRLNHVPDWTAKYGADWTPVPRLTASFWAYGQGNYFLTDANARPTYGGYTAVNADLSVRLARGMGVGLAVQNLFDRAFEYVWLDGTATRHSPANPRSAFLTLRLDR